MRCQFSGPKPYFPDLRNSLELSGVHLVPEAGQQLVGLPGDAVVALGLRHLPDRHWTGATDKVPVDVVISLNIYYRLSF